MAPDQEQHLRPSLLIVSNGHGEDAVGAVLADRLTPYADVYGYPLVGLGKSYRGIRLLEPRREFPSGGFALRAGWRTLVADLGRGAFRHWRAQRRTLAQQHRQHPLVVAIGDVYCLWMAGSARTSAIFVATAKSVYNEPYRALERMVMRNLARVVFVRDPLTAAELTAQGIPARYVGNPLMDTIQLDGPTRPRNDGVPTVTLLPGSREDAYGNVAVLLRLVGRASRQRTIRWLCVVAPTVEVSGIQATARAEGWMATGELLRLGAAEVALTSAFGEALQAADVVVGLAGTANEQAAGLAKPVVAFPGPGSQFTRRFLRLQKRLLGDALAEATSWEDASNVVLRLLGNAQERQRRGQVGRARMGSSGAVAAIAQEIRSSLDTSLRV